MSTENEVPTSQPADRTSEPEPTTEQVYSALEEAIEEACDVDTRNEISAAYRRIMRERGFTEGNEEE